MKKRYKTGVVHGRFQGFHLDHLKYVMAAAERCEHLVVGITNPDPLLTKDDPADPGRSAPDANPFTYFERYHMVRNNLLHLEIAPERFSIVPFPINRPELWHYYVPRDAVFFLTIYDEWGRKKRLMLEERGLKVEVLWERPVSEKGIRATEVRRLMSSGDPGWQDLVPQGTIRAIQELGITLPR